MRRVSSDDFRIRMTYWFKRLPIIVTKYNLDKAVILPIKIFKNIFEEKRGGENKK